MEKKIGRLHVLTDTVLQSRFTHVQLTKMAIAGGADAIQFREKTGSSRQMIETARKIQALCAEKGVPLIVNDRVDVALAVDAHGVHLGQDDVPIPLARELLGPAKIIGGSAATIEKARACLSDGADYVGIGPVYATGSKSDAGAVVGTTRLKEMIPQIPLPVIAIGGIDERRIRPVMDAGAYGVAVISAVCCTEDPEAATRTLSDALQKRS